MIMRVVILMSTYQGERYIGEQLRSILVQLPADGRLLIRDDGSVDGTVNEINLLSEPRIEIIRGENVGFARSFLLLMNAAPTDADLYMLADQDDVWLPTKIQRAAHYVAKVTPTTPTLYCSRLR